MRNAAWVIFSILLFFQAACGREGDSQKAGSTLGAPPQESLAVGISETQGTAAAAKIQQELEKKKAKDARMLPCSLFKSDELEKILGTPVRAGKYEARNVSEKENEYAVETCFWERIVETGSDLSLNVSLPEHFAAKKVECTPLVGKPKALKVAGKPGWWNFHKSIGRGTLRVCNSDALVQIRVDKDGDDESALKTRALDIAKQTLKKVKKG